MKKQLKQKSSQKRFSIVYAIFLTDMITETGMYTKASENLLLFTTQNLANAWLTAEGVSQQDYPIIPLQLRVTKSALIH